MNLRVWRPVVGLWLCAGLAATAAEGRRGGGPGQSNQPQQNSARLDAADSVLGLACYEVEPAADSG